MRLHMTKRGKKESKWGGSQYFFMGTPPPHLHAQKASKKLVLDTFRVCLCVWDGGWGVDGGWMPLPTCPQRYCDPASLVTFWLALTNRHTDPRTVKRANLTDQQTDWRTDWRTDVGWKVVVMVGQNWDKPFKASVQVDGASYRVACPQLKMGRLQRADVLKPLATH